MAAWRKSGQTVSDFAESRGVPAGRLKWWRWRLGVEGSARPATSDGLRLVPVDVEPAAPALITSASVAPAWELTTARGDVLRVYPSAGHTELKTVLSAILARGGRR